MKTFLKYLITMVVGLALTAWLAWARDIMAQTELVKIYHILCDSFFITGVIITSTGSLIFVGNEGAFDPIVYGLRSFANIFKKRDKRKMESYYDYRMARLENKLGFVFLLICGVVFLAVSGVMYMQYSKYYAESLAAFSWLLTAV